MSSKRTVRPPEWESGPTAADLAAIDAEWPVIAAELDALDAEIRALTYGSGLSEIEVRRARRAARVALRPVSTSAGSNATSRGGEAA